MIKCYYFIRLARRDGNLIVIFKESAISEFSNSSNRPPEASPKQFPGEGDINNDLLVGGLFIVFNLLDIFGTRVSDPSSNVEEANGGHEDIPSVAVAESKAGI